VDREVLGHLVVTETPDYLELLEEVGLWLWVQPEGLVEVTDSMG